MIEAMMLALIGVLLAGALAFPISFLVMMLALIGVLFAGALALPISVLVRIGFLPFSKRVQGQVRNHPILHVLWLLAATVVFLLVFVATGSDRPRKSEKTTPAALDNGARTMHQR